MGVDIETLKPERRSEQPEATVETTVDTVVTEAKSADFEQTAESPEHAKPTSDAGDGEDAVQAAAQRVDASDDTVFLPVYNGVTMPISASDTERVTMLLQKGMKFENMAEDMERLYQLKDAYHASTIREVICMIAEEKERAVRDEYVSRYGEEAGVKLFELEKAQQAALRGSFQQADEAADEASMEANDERLSKEFAQLKTEYPTVASMDDVPQAVKDTALQKGISLLDAYNRHILNEQRRAASAVKQQVANQQTAIGSLADGGADTVDPVWEAFVRGML